MTSKTLPTGVDSRSRDPAWRILGSATDSDGEQHVMLIGATRQGETRLSVDLLNRGLTYEPSSVSAGSSPSCALAGPSGVAK